MKNTAPSHQKPEIVTCPEFGRQENVGHGFFMRKGGVSEGIYASLNLGAGSKDNPENVKQNRKIAMQAFGHNFKDAEILECNLHTLYQIHSNKVITVYDKFAERLEADALVTNKPNIVLGILTADCTPVLFADDKAKIVGAAHAGWKGAFSGILENTIYQMCELGADKKNIKAVIGPTIAQDSYEVGQDFYDRFRDESEEYAQFFIASKKAGHYMFDLPAFVQYRLHNAGISQVTNVNRDTYAEEENFFSYRRTCHKGEPDYGRNLSVIALR